MAVKSSKDNTAFFDLSCGRYSHLPLLLHSGEKGIFTTLPTCYPRAQVTEEREEEETSHIYLLFAHVRITFIYFFITLKSVSVGPQNICVNGVIHLWFS
jgi:hypothetical protein